MPASVMHAVPAVTRSSMELMLDSIRRRDEQQSDAPPALPARPTSRARLPSARRSLPPGFGIARSLPESPEEKENRAPQEGREAALRGDIYASKRVTKMDQMVPEIRAALRPTLPEPMDGKVTALVDASNQTLQGILSIQKHFRGLHSRLQYQELKGGVITLQSFVRGERTRSQFNFLIKRLRAVVLIQKDARRWIARKIFHGHRKKVIILQSVIRSWLARRHFSSMKNLEMTKYSQVKCNREAGSNFQNMKDTNIENPQPHHSIVAELQMRVLKAETELKQKEEENITLKKELQQYEMRWSEYEAKMKSMEEIWQRQMTSLQISLAAARKSLATDILSPPAKPVASPVDHYYESEDYLSAETRTPEGTPAKQPYTSSNRTSDCTVNAVNLLLKEFEQRKEVFEDDAGFLVEVKSGPSGSIFNPDDEFGKLKARFAAWTKDFKVRLRETKSALKKIGNQETKKTHKKWWRKKSTTKA